MGSQERHVLSEESRHRIDKALLGELHDVLDSKLAARTSAEKLMKAERP